MEEGESFHVISEKQLLATRHCKYIQKALEKNVLQKILEKKLQLKTNCRNVKKRRNLSF
jgi:hypothetical protein